MQRINPAKASVGYYGAEGDIAPVFSCGGQPLAPSFLTGDGSHMGLWVSVAIHLVALALTVTSNIVFFTADRSEGLDLVWGWALSSLIGQSCAVLGTVVSTGFVKDCLSMPIMNTFGAGLFLCAFIATAKVSYSHSGLPADASENVLFNFALLFQGFGIASIVSNGLTCASSKSAL